MLLIKIIMYLLDKQRTGLLIYYNFSGF